MFQQDFAPSNISRNGLAKNFHGHVNPHNLSPQVPYSGMLSRVRPTMTPHNTKDSLKVTIMDRIANMNENHLIQAFNQYQGHIEAKSSFIE